MTLLGGGVELPGGDAQQNLTDVGTQMLAELLTP
jgi:hypothetical protein